MNSKPSAKEATTRANQSALELERAVQRRHSNEERIAELEVRSAAGTAELEQAKQHLQGLTSERDSQRSFLETAAAEAAAFREQAQAVQSEGAGRFSPGERGRAGIGS